MFTKLVTDIAERKKLRIRTPNQYTSSVFAFLSLVKLSLITASLSFPLRFGSNATYSKKASLIFPPESNFFLFLNWWWFSW